MKQPLVYDLPYLFMKLLCRVLCLVLAVMLLGSMLFHALLGQIHFSRDVSYTPEGLLTAVAQKGREFLSPEDTPALGQGSGIVNILLIGQDRREGEDFARSDSMILCTFHKQSKTITMTSFLRDLYVPIPGFGKNRINASYAFGGMKLLRRTLEENFAVPIDGCIEVDFDQFSGIIDLLGGVDMELRQDEASVINQQTGSALTEGCHRLTGAQALVYSRIRSLDGDGDFSRTNRQRKVLSALLDSLRSAPFADLISTTGQLMPLIATDMNRAQILKCALDVLPSLSGAQIRSQRIPADGTYQDKMIDGMAVLEADLDAARQLLRETLQS